MEYKVIKDADKIVGRSPYVVSNPTSYKNKWHELFGNNNPIHLELGMGRGDFIINMAKTYPKINFIGLEIVDSQMVKAVNRLNNQKLPNLKLINIDAHEIDNIFTHLNYLKIYDKIFKKNKHIILKTDNKGFFAYSLETLSQYWYVFDRVSLDLHHDENPIPNIMTDFERRYYEEGRPIYYLDASFKN